ncbi:MAG: V-type ATP synthase subunit E [Spirochaetia bacterium]|nr:V-type ATP synthase subunit E [Spirochaetia bacterium]
MDIRVQELLDRIKHDGLESAEAEAGKIRAEAQAQAKGIVDAAKAEAKALVDAAKADAARAEEAGRAALAQASRDLVLAFRADIDKLLSSIVRTDTEKAMGADALARIIPTIVEQWAKDGRDDLSVLLPESDLAPVEAQLRSRLSDKLRSGVELKPIKGAKAGFRIGEKNGAAYYDFSADAVADMLSAYLNTRLAAIMSSALK